MYYRAREGAHQIQEKRAAEDRELASNSFALIKSYMNRHCKERDFRCQEIF